MTDREIRSTEQLDALDFDKGEGLVPVVVQDARTREVLVQAWASRPSLERTLATGFVHFWSRSRREIWMKGATSGHTLAVSSLHADCDGDAVLALATPAGPTCHTGERSCFGDVPTGPSGTARGTLARLDGTLASRAAERPEGSYTVRLLDDPNLRLKKVGEETAELVAALATGDGPRAVEEAADLLYHVLVALRAEGLGADALLETLEKRAD